MVQLSLLDNDYRQTKKYIDGIFKTKKEIIDILIEDGKDDIYHVLSFGAGTQSTHLLEEHFKGNIHYDFIVFSDTGAEPQFIHDQVAWWKNRQKEYGNTTPFITTHHNSMKNGLEEMLFRYLETDYQRFQMPLYFNRLDENGKERIADFFEQDLSKSETIKLLKDEYGFGGRSVTGYSQQHDSKGIEIRLDEIKNGRIETIGTRHYSWSQVYDALFNLIRAGEYFKALEVETHARHEKSKRNHHKRATQSWL